MLSEAQLEQYLRLLGGKDDDGDGGGDSEDDDEGGGGERESIPTDVGLRHLAKCDYQLPAAERGLDTLLGTLDVAEVNGATVVREMPGTSSRRPTSGASSTR